MPFAMTPSGAAIPVLAAPSIGVAAGVAKPRRAAR